MAASTPVGMPIVANNNAMRRQLANEDPSRNLMIASTRWAHWVYSFLASGPSQHDDFLSQLLFVAVAKHVPEQVDAHQFIAKFLGGLSQKLTGADHDSKIGSLIADHISKLSTRIQHIPQSGQMPRHPAEVQTGRPAIQSLEAGCLAKRLDPPRLDLICDALDARMMLDPAIIIIAFVYHRVSARQLLFEATQTCLGIDESQQDGLPRVVRV